MAKTKVVKRVPLNLTGSDAELAERLRLHFVDKLAIGHVSAVAVARLAMKALAEKEGLA